MRSSLATHYFLHRMRKIPVLLQQGIYVFLCIGSYVSHIAVIEGRRVLGVLYISKDRLRFFTESSKACGIPLLPSRAFRSDLGLTELLSLSVTACPS